jgi:hypothetical protein
MFRGALDVPGLGDHVAVRGPTWRAYEFVSRLPLVRQYLVVLVGFTAVSFGLGWVIGTNSVATIHTGPHPLAWALLCAVPAAIAVTVYFRGGTRDRGPRRPWR